jgi:uncharacterized phage protein (TIGR02218 family)
MSYESIETSRDDARPVELYEFRYSGQIFYYTSGAEPIERDGRSYTPEPISRSEVVSSTEAAAQELSITAPATLAVADLFRVAPPSEVVSVTIYRHHRSDPASEFAVYWQGRVLGAEWAGNEVTLSAESVQSSLSRLGLRRRYGAVCPHELYGPACRALRSHLLQTGVVSSISGSQIATTVVNEAGWFAGGYIEWDIPNSPQSESRAVVSSTAEGVLLLSSFPRLLKPGLAIRAYPGCDHTLVACKTKFDNLDNFGGFPYFPQKNPFGSNPLY